MFIWEEERPYFFNNLLFATFLVDEAVAEILMNHFTIENEWIKYLMIFGMIVLTLIVFYNLSKLLDKCTIFEWQRVHGPKYNRHIESYKELIIAPGATLVLSFVLTVLLEIYLKFNHLLVTLIIAIFAFIADLIIMHNFEWLFKHKILVKEEDFKQTGIMTKDIKK